MEWESEKSGRERWCGIERWSEREMEWERERDGVVERGRWNRGESERWMGKAESGIDTLNGIDIH